MMGCQFSYVYIENGVEQSIHRVNVTIFAPMDDYDSVSLQNNSKVNSKNLIYFCCFCFYFKPITFFHFIYFFRTNYLQNVKVSVKSEEKKHK